MPSCAMINLKEHEKMSHGICSLINFHKKQYQNHQKCRSLDYEKLVSSSASMSGWSIMFVTVSSIDALFLSSVGSSSFSQSSLAFETP